MNRVIENRRSKTPLVMCLLVFGWIATLASAASAQCIEHPDKKTAVKFNNETRFELVFLIDDDEEGLVVAARTLSEEVNVLPGEHLFRARVVVRGETFLVWVVNEVPKEQLCIWTITDPAHGTARTDKYRTAMSIGYLLESFSASLVEKR